MYVGLTWSEYWANEGVYMAGSTETNSETDDRDEHDKGAFDTVTRASSVLQLFIQQTEKHSRFRAGAQMAAL